MTATATLNVRLPKDLKDRGMQVLEREGVSVSDLIRDLFSEMEKTQEIPDFVARDWTLEKEKEIARKRSLLSDMAGIVPGDIDVNSIREERLQKHCFTGVLR